MIDASRFGPSDDFTSMPPTLSSTARWRFRSYRDPLTGLLNVRYLRVQLARRGASSRGSLFLAAELVGLADLESAEGKETARRVLRLLARAFRELVGYRGLLFHVGGGQFVATFVPGDAETAITVLRAMREAVRDVHASLSVVFGWAIAPSEGAGLHELSHVALSRMNASRKRGPGDTRLLSAGGKRER